MRLTVHSFLTLDGVMQGPGSPEEDPSDGFESGGWLVPYVSDEEFGEIVTSWFARTEALLFGRRTFELMRGFWPQVTDPADPVAHALNTLPKYVVSGTLAEPGWEPTTIITGDPIDAITRLKERPGGELQVHGCARLAASLHAAGLIDEYRLLVAPGSVGPRTRGLTTAAPPAGLRLLETRPTTSGAVYSALESVPFVRGDITVEDGQEVVTVEGS